MAVLRRGAEGQYRRRVRRPRKASKSFFAANSFKKRLSMMLTVYPARAPVNVHDAAIVQR
jgi:hypothetical protein